MAEKSSKPARNEQYLFDTVIRKLHKQGAPCFKTTLDEWDPHPCTLNIKGHVSAVTSLLPTESLTRLRREVGYDKVQAMTPHSMREVWAPIIKTSEPASRDTFLAEYRTMEALELEGIDKTLLGFVIRLEEAHREIVNNMVKDKMFNDEDTMKIWYKVYLDTSFRKVMMGKSLNSSVLNFQNP